MMLRRLLPLLFAAALAGCVGGREAAPPAPIARPAPQPVPRPAVQPVAPPAWKAQAVIADALDVPASTYVVQPGDSLRGISKKTGAGSEAIARANRIPAPFVIKAGQRLRIPGGRYHLVRPGQSGIAIARAYGVDWSSVVTLNDLEEPYILRTGQRVLLPSRAQVAAMTMEQRAAAFTIDIDDLITGAEPALAARQKPVAPVASPKRALPATAVVSEPGAFAGNFGWPLEGRLIARFGPLGQGRVSNGLNIAAASGTPIKAAADGTVAYVGEDIPAMGKLILLRHGDGWITAYAHASETLVARGQAVKRGDVIARSGSSGSVDEPQLHFELRRARAAVDPLKYLPRRS
jgi:lipoprotein NlpD